MGSRRRGVDVALVEQVPPHRLSRAALDRRRGRVEVRLSFQADHIRLSVSDDGVGLPDDYAERGRVSRAEGY